MKKALVFIFLLIILIQSGGMNWCFKLKQLYVQFEANENLMHANAAFDTLLLSTSDYLSNLKDEGKEIEWLGKRYDIKSISYRANKVIILAYHDIKEESLIKHMAVFLKHISNKHENNPAALNLLLTLNYLNPENEFALQQVAIPISKIASKTISCITYQAQISSPPPQFIF